MRAVVAFALVALVAANAPHRSRIPNPQWSSEIFGRNDGEDIKDQRFRANREFRYVYNGQLATGIPQSSRQHAMTRIQAVVSLVFKTDNVCLLKLTHVRMGQLNREVPNPRQVLPFQAFEEVQINEDLMKQLVLPIQFKYNHGLVSEIVFDGEEQPWSANIKRGVLNMLQVNLKQHGRTDLSEEQLLLNSVQAPETPEYDFFTAQERTLEGDCETHYTITKQPYRYRSSEAEVLNVTKTINFEKCRQRPDIRYNKRFGEQCNSCERKYANDEKQTQSSTVARYNITGSLESFMIESAVVESHYMFTPINEEFNIIATYVNQTLVLVRSGPVVSRVEEPNNPQPSDSQMIYTPDWDIKKERFFMEGDQDFLKSTPYSEVKNKVEFVEQIIRKLIQHMQHEDGIDQEAPRQLARLVKILRMCTQSELKKIHQTFVEQADKIETEHKQKVKDILIDAMTLAATKNTIEHFVEMTKERQVNPIKAAVAIKALINTRVVSEKQIELVMSLCKHQVSQKNPVLRQSCYLTVGSMINALCKDNDDKLAVEFKVQSQKMCPRSLKDKYIKEFLDLFQQSTTKYEKILALKALANAGIDLSIFELEKIIKNTGLGAPHETIIRSQAIDALRQLRTIMPRKIQKILMPIFKNQRELPEIRMTAVAQIMQTHPERPILDQIAEQLVLERSQQVSAFVYTMLRTFANSTHECERRLAQDLQLSLRHARSIPLFRLIGKSFFAHLPAYSRKLNLGATLNLATIATNDSYLPKEVMASINAAYGGQWIKYLAQIGFIQQNSEELIEKLLGHQGLLSENTLEQLLSRPRRAASEFQSKTILRDIFEKLGVRARRSSEQTPTAMLYIRYKDMDYALLPMDAETIPEGMKKMLENSRLNIEQLERFLSQGFHLDFHTGAFVHETSRKLPTSLGVPIEVSFRMPTVASINGMVKLQLQPKDKIQRVKLQIVARPTVAATMCTRVEAWTPIVNTGLKIVETVQVNLPIDTDVELNVEKQPMELKWVVKTPKREVRILSAQARPITYTRVWPKFLKTYAEPEEQTVFGEEWDRVKTFDTKVGDNVVGIQCRVRGQVQRTPYNALVGTPAGPFAGNNYLQVTLSPGHEAPEEIIVRTQVSLFNNGGDELRPSMNRFYESEETKNFFDSSSSSESESSESGESGESNSKSAESGDSESSSSSSGSSSSESKETQAKPKKSSDASKTQRLQHVEQFDKYHKEFRASKPFQHQMTVVVETRGSSVPRKAELLWKSNCGQDLRHCQWEILLTRSAIPAGKLRESQPWVFQAKGQYLYPEVPYTLKQLEELSDSNDKFTAQVDIEWGPQGRKESQFVTLKVKGSRSELQKQLLRRSLYSKMYKTQMDNELFSPVQQYEQLLKAAALTEYKLSAEYKVNDDVANVTNKLYRLLKYWQMWNSDVAQVNVNNPDNRIMATVTIDPRSYQYVNVTCRMPDENVTFTDVSVPFPLMPLNLRRASEPVRSVDDFFRTVTGSFSQAKCKVSSEGRVETFDDSKFPVPLTTCYSVLAKDCSGYGQPKFAVLMKKLSSGSDAKKVKIITTESVIEMYAVENKYMSNKDKLVKVKVNGKEIDINDEETLRDHGIWRQGPYVRLSAPEVGLQVAFDGYACTVKLSTMYRNAQCGLCGHFDGEKLDEWRMADNELTDDLQRFYRSYFHRDDECVIEEEEVSNWRNYDKRPTVWDESSSSSSESDEDSDEAISEESSSSSEEIDSAELPANNFRQNRQLPRQMTKTIEYSHEICFSKKPVPVCPKNSYAVEYDEEQKVSFCCLPRTSAEAHTLQRLAEQGKVVQTEALKPSFVETVLIPKRCAQF